MKSCRFTRTSKFLRWCAVFYFPIIAALLLVVCITFLIPVFRHELVHPLFMVFMFFAGTAVAWFLLRLGLDGYKFESRKYSISESGITVSSHRKQVRTIPWEEVNEICISVFSTTSALQSYQEVICIFTLPRASNFLEKIAHSYYYAARNLDSFIVIDYTENTMNILRSVYPGKISDVRNEQLRQYSLN